MASNNIEIEVKFPLKNPEQVVAFLNANAEELMGNLFQRDTYYTPAHRDFIAVNFPYEWLRLRETVKGVYLTYKHYYPENTAKTNYCNEFETKVDSIESIKKIFSSLNFNEIAVVEKKRKTWKYKETEISVDEVKDLGTFIEVEATEDFEDHKKMKEFLYSIVNEINADVGVEDLRGYPFLVLEKQGHKFKTDS